MHPPGALINVDENVLVAPSGRAPDAHVFQGLTVALNDQVVETGARLVDPLAAPQDPPSDASAATDDAGAYPDAPQAPGDAGDPPDAPGGGGP